MYRVAGILGVAIGLAVGAAADAADTVRTANASYSGEITAMGPVELTIKTRRGDVTTSVSEIVSVTFESEPPMLNAARQAAVAGRYEDALGMLERIDPAKVSRDSVRQDIAFYQAMSAARLALRGQGSVPEAGGRMAAFVAGAKDNYHWFEANELVGDLLMANGQFAAAVDYYAVVAEAPWPEVQRRAKIAVGRAELAAGELDAALGSFQKILDAACDDNQPECRRQQLLATLGKARCFVAQGKPDEALPLVEQVIAQAGAEDSLVQARAHNALGTALRKLDKPQEALLAFLRVDVLYFAQAEEHAEALANLAELWNEVHQPGRAIQAQQTLKNRYRNTRWATQ